jgi:FXSXX-COOH protein
MRRQGTGMRVDTDEFTSDLIDVTGLSLKDLETLPESSLTVALREVLAANGTGTSAGFSSRLRRAE